MPTLDDNLLGVMNLNFREQFIILYILEYSFNEYRVKINKFR